MSRILLPCVCVFVWQSISGCLCVRCACIPECISACKDEGQTVSVFFSSSSSASSNVSQPGQASQQKNDRYTGVVWQGSSAGLTRCTKPRGALTLWGPVEEHLHTHTHTQVFSPKKKKKELACGRRLWCSSIPQCPLWSLFPCCRALTLKPEHKSKSCVSYWCQWRQWRSAWQFLIFAQAATVGKSSVASWMRRKLYFLLCNPPVQTLPFFLDAMIH